MPRLCHLHALVWLLLAAAVPGCACWRKTACAEQLAQSRSIATQGLEAAERGDWTTAEQHYAAAIQACPEDERARARYAEALWRRGAQKEAVAHMEEAVRLSKQAPERTVQLGRMQFETQNNESAEKQVTRALVQDRELASAWVLKGDLASRENRTEEALSHYLRAQSLPNCPPETAVRVADLYLALDRPQRALSTLQQVANQYPPGQAPVEILHRQGVACRSLGRYSDAVTQLAAAAAQAPPSADLLADLASSQFLAGDVANARLTTSAALARNPRQTVALGLREKFEQPHATVSHVVPLTERR